MRLAVDAAVAAVGVAVAAAAAAAAAVAAAVGRAVAATMYYRRVRQGHLAVLLRRPGGAGGVLREGTVFGEFMDSYNSHPEMYWSFPSWFWSVPDFAFIGCDKLNGVTVGRAPRR